MAPAVGPDPSSLACPSCRQTITTRLDYETTTKTHIMAGLLCCFMYVSSGDVSQICLRWTQLPTFQSYLNVAYFLQMLALCVGAVRHGFVQECESLLSELWRFYRHVQGLGSRHQCTRSTHTNLFLIHTFGVWYTTNVRLKHTQNCTSLYTKKIYIHNITSASSTYICRHRKINNRVFAFENTR